MTRAKFDMVIFGPPGGAIDRALEALREMGYTVDVAGHDHVGRRRRVFATAQAPYGEVAERRFIGRQRRRA